MAVNQADTVAYAIATCLTNVATQAACTTAQGTAGGVSWWANFALNGSVKNVMNTVEQQDGQCFNTNMIPNK